MNKIRQTLVFGFAIMGLSGCASSSYEAPQVPVPQASAPVSHPAQAQVTPKPVSKPELRPMASDTCGAAALQYLVGKPRTEIPVPIDPSSRRVVCSTCITTQEYRADRQTILFDSDTGLIKSVTCG